MNLELLLPLCIYLVLVLGVGFWASRHRVGGDFVQEYFIGNRSMGGLVLAMTLVATYTSASSFIGGPGAAYKIGLGWVLLAMIQLPTVWLTLGVLGKKFAIIARRVNAVTIDPKLVSPQGAGDMLTQPFMLSFWVLVCVGVVGLPHSALRCFGYRDSKALHRGILIGTIVSAFLMFGMHLAGALGRAILPGMDSPDKIMPSLMMEVLPPWLAGVFLAAPMAAIMSTIDSQLIQASATLVKDLYLNYLSPEKAGQEKLEVRVPRLSLLCTLILGTLVLLAALQPPEMIIWLNLLAFGGLQAVFLWPLVLGLYWSRANGPGALASMVCGILCYAILSQWGIKLAGLHAIVPSLALGLVAFVLVSLLTPAPSQSVRRLFEPCSAMD